MNATLNELQKKQTSFLTKAEADYFKAIDLNPDLIDAYYNLGALTNNKTAAIADIINNIDAKTQAEYDKRFAALKKVQDSIYNVAIEQFLKVEDIAMARSEKTTDDKILKYTYLKDVYFSLQLIYAGKNNEAKSTEYRAKKEEMIMKIKKK